MGSRNGNSLDLMQVFGVIKGLMEQSKDRKFLEREFPGLVGQINPDTGQIPAGLAARAGQSEAVSNALKTYLGGQEFGSVQAGRKATTAATTGGEKRSQGEYDKLGGVTPSGMNAQTMKQQLDQDIKKYGDEKFHFEGLKLGPTANTAQVATQNRGIDVTDKNAGQQGMIELLKILSDPVAQMGGGGMMSAISELFSGGKGPTDASGLLASLGQGQQGARAAKAKEQSDIVAALGAARGGATKAAPSKEIPAKQIPMSGSVKSPQRGSQSLGPATAPSGFEHLFQRQPGGATPQHDMLKQQLLQMTTPWQLPGGVEGVGSLTPEQIAELPPEIQQLIQQYMATMGVFGPNK